MNEIDSLSNIQKPGWTRPRPETLARATWWPAALAFGATLFVWGLLISLVIVVIGVVVCAMSLAGWIAEIRHEHKS
jgi:fatty acid desaturase